MKFCIIGYPLKHSLSPAFYNRYFDAAGIKATYEAVEIYPEEFEEKIHQILEEYDGFNVTIPYKERVLGFVKPGKNAEVIQAVNCVFEGVGYNTDWKGFVDSLEGVELGEPVLVVGAGGASRAILYGLHRMGKNRVILLNRTFERALKLAKYFERFGLSFEVRGLNELREVLPKALSFINTTSVGLKGERFSIFPEDLSHLEVVYDVVYGGTPLQKMAEKAGVRHVIDGRPMLYFQAVENLKIWGLFRSEELFMRVFEEVAS